MVDDDENDLKTGDQLEINPAGDKGMELPTPDGGVAAAAPAGAVEESRDVFDLGLDAKSSFRMLRKTVRHFVAHEEYGVIFSFCGIRTTKKLVEFDPPPKQSDIRCEKCKQAIWQEVASATYAKKMKEKKDLDD